MADAVFTDEMRAPRAARVLGLATAGLFCVLAAAAFGITLLGKAPQPDVVLDLPVLPQAKFIQPRIEAAEAIPAPVVIDKAVFAGSALVADPALIENSPLGPLPRIADDGRKPMAAYAAPAAPGKCRIAIMV